MRLTTISDDFFVKTKFDGELMDSEERRPYLIVLRLKYSGVRQDFAVPFRSNISPDTPKHQFFSLPPRDKTKTYHSHGIHYTKMFPIRNEYLQKFNTDNSSYYDLIHDIISKNTKRIVTEAQQYLDRYESGVREQFCTNIHGIYLMLNGQLEVKEVAASKEKVDEK